MHLGAFGKHKGWNDHIDDPGMDTQRLVDFKTLVYVEGVAPAIDSGRWDALDAESRVEGFAHVLLLRTRADLLLARLWSSSDGKGRTKYPMGAAAHVRGVGLEWAIANILPELESVQQRCEQATTAEQVRGILESARGTLRARCGASEGGSKGMETTIPAGFAGVLGESPEYGPAHLGMQRVIYQLHREAAMFELGAKSASRLGKTDQPPSIQLRLPVVQSGPGGDNGGVGGGMLGCVRLLLTKLEPWTPMLLVASLRRPFVDVILGEPHGAQLFCLQAGEKVLPLTTKIPYTIDAASAAEFEGWYGAARSAPAREIPIATNSSRRSGSGRFLPALLAAIVACAGAAGPGMAQPVVTNPSSATQPEPRTQYNTMLANLKVAVVDTSAPDAETRATVTKFLADVRALPGGIAYLVKVQVTLEAIESALKNPEVGATAPGTLLLGPGSTGRYTGAAEGPLIRFKGTGVPELTFARVDMPGGESVYMATTECSVGQFAGIVSGMASSDAFTKTLRSFDRISDPRPGPRSWEWIDSMGRRGGIMPAKAWLARRGVATNTDYPADGAPPAPSAESPMQFLSPAAALYASELIGCRLPTVSEWTTANAKAGPAAKANLRDAAWKKQWDFAQGQRSMGVACQLPDGGAFVPSGAKLSPRPDAIWPETDGTLWFTNVGTGAGETIRNLVGNVAEYVLDVPASEMPEAKPGATDSFIEAHAAQVHVIGGSALSDPAIQPGQPQPVSLEEAREGYADVGFRPCFSAGFTPGGGQSLAARIGRLIEPLPTIP